MFPKYIRINELSVLQNPNLQGKHLLNLTAVSSFSQTVITHNKRLDLTAPVITHHKFYIESSCVSVFTLNSCDGKAISLKADWLYMSTTVLKCDLAMPRVLTRRNLFILCLFGTQYHIFTKNFCLVIKK